MASVFVRFLCLICLQLVVQSEEILDSGSLKTCPRPRTPKNAIISHLETHRIYSDSSNSRGYGVDEYHELDRVYYQCKDGYSQSDYSILYSTCGSNGKWFPDLSKGKKCLPNRKFDRCLSGLFMCKSDNICISGHLRCDCYTDCADGSDEIGCDFRQYVVKAPFRGRDSSGIISSPGFPLRYPKNFVCTYHINTLPGYFLELYFSEFDVPSKDNGNCRDYVIIDGTYREKTKYGLKEVTSQRKCGNKTIRGLFTNSSRIMVNVSMGNMRKYDRSYRGFVLSWKVRNKAYIKKFAIAKSQKYVSKNHQDDKSDGNYTLIAPIIIAAVIPTLLIAFVCLRKQRLQRIYLLCKHKNESVKRRKERNQPATNALLLTTENLERFNNQALSEDSCKDRSENRTLISKERERYLQQSGNTYCTVSSSPHCKNNSNSDNSNSRHNNSLEKHCGSKKHCNSKQGGEATASTDSDHPRYVLSYDLLRKCTPTKQKKNNQLELQRNCTQQKYNCNRTSLNNVNNNIYNNNKTAANVQPVCDTSKSSKESKDNGTSSRNSRATSQCSYCAHRKSLQKPKRLSPVGYECRNFGESTDVTSAFEDLHNFNEYKEHGTLPNEEKLFALYSEQMDKSKNIDITDNGFLETKDGLKAFIDNNKYGETDGPDGLQPRLYHLNQTNIVVLPSTNNESIDKVFYKTRGGSLLCTH